VRPRRAPAAGRLQAEVLGRHLAGRAFARVLASPLVRARHVIDRAATASGDVALFAHAHILRILAACWLEFPPMGGNATPVHLYEPGTWGPGEADRLTAEVGGWHAPS
jgi:broad specificity phosphatase PhoE